MAWGNFTTRDFLGAVLGDFFWEASNFAPHVTCI